MTGRMHRRVTTVATGLLVALSVLATVPLGSASAEPAEPVPADPANTSTTDELADMVIEVVQSGASLAPTTTPVPTPAG